MIWLIVLLELVSVLNMMMIVRLVSRVCLVFRWLEIVLVMSMVMFMIVM